MTFSRNDYNPIPRDEDLSKHSKDFYYLDNNSDKRRRRSQFTTWILTISLLVNLLVGIQILHGRLSSTQDPLKCATKYAGLVWNSTGQFEHQGLYDSPNKTLTDQAWDELDYNPGSVALSDEFTESLGIPRAQRFPWDESKGLYFINAYHGIHCLKILRLTITELDQSLPLTFPYAHSMHCLEALLQDVMCLADDTPRYTSEEHPGQPGELQPRVCRDWKRLEAFAHEHTSCWRDIEPNRDIDTLLRYRYCPADSPYTEKIHAIFGDFETGPGANSTN